MHTVREAAVLSLSKLYEAPGSRAIAKFFMNFPSDPEFSAFFHANLPKDSTIRNFQVQKSVADLRVLLKVPMDYNACSSISQACHVRHQKTDSQSSGTGSASQATWEALSRHMAGGMRLRKHLLEERLRTTYPCDPHKTYSSGVSWTTPISSLLLVGLHSCSFSHIVPFGLFSVLDYESVWNTRHTLL